MRQPLIFSFNSRPHEEVDAIPAVVRASVCTFQFTTSRRGRPVCCSFWPPKSSFNSRPHEEVDLGDQAIYIVPQPFNSRPHEEVDQATEDMLKKLDLSIHDLTKRSTCRLWKQLARGFSFNSRPHEEVDLVRAVGGGNMAFFQFTTSRRGRPGQAEQKNIQTLSFNSRPHEEVDNISSYFLPLICLSIHDLTKRSTFPGIYQEHHTVPFNSRPHEEVDQLEPQR